MRHMSIIGCVSLILNTVHRGGESVVKLSINLIIHTTHNISILQPFLANKQKDNERVENKSY